MSLLHAHKKRHHHGHAAISEIQPLQSFAETTDEEKDAEGNPINPKVSYIKKVANGVTIWTHLNEHINETEWVKETEKPTGYLQKAGAYAQQETQQKHKHFKVPAKMSTARLFDWGDKSEEKENEGYMGVSSQSAYMMQVKDDSADAAAAKEKSDAAAAALMPGGKTDAAAAKEKSDAAAAALMPGGKTDAAAAKAPAADDKKADAKGADAKKGDAKAADEKVGAGAAKDGEEKKDGDKPHFYRKAAWTDDQNDTTHHKEYDDETKKPSGYLDHIKAQTSADL